MSDVASSLVWCSIGMVDGDRKLRREAIVQQNPCTEKCDVWISLRPYLSCRLQDKPSCLVSKGGNVDLLLDELNCLQREMVDSFVVRIIDLLTDGMVDFFVFVSTDRSVQYKLNAQFLRLFCVHSDVNDAHRAGANRLKNKKQNIVSVLLQNSHTS